MYVTGDGQDSVPRFDVSLTNGVPFSLMFIFVHISRFSFFRSHKRSRASCLGRNTAGASNRAEPAENRRAQRRHRLGRHTRNPASTSHGRLRSGVDLSGRVSRGHIVVFDFCASNSALLTKLKTKPKTRVKSSFPGTFTKFYEYATFPAPKRHIIFARQPITHFAPRRVVRPNTAIRYLHCGDGLVR